MFKYLIDCLFDEACYEDWDWVNNYDPFSSGDLEWEYDPSTDDLNCTMEYIVENFFSPDTYEPCDQSAFFEHLISCY